MKKSRLLALVPAVALVLGVVPLLATPASAAADPVWETGNADKVGTLTFYDAAGTVITSGSTTARPFVKYVAASQVNTVDNKATLYFAAPDPNLPIASWASFQSSGSTVYPLASGPSTVTGITNRPVATGSSGDFNLSDFLGSVTLSNAAGYANMVQLRVYTSRPGSFSTTYATADILISGSTWTQVYPAPATTQPTTTSVTANPVGSVTPGGSVTFTATVSPTGVAGSVEFFDGATSLGAGTYTQATGKATLTTTALTSLGAHTIKATFTPTDTVAHSASEGSLAYTVADQTTPAPTSIVLSALQSTVAYGVPRKVTAVVGSLAGVPTGTITVMDGGTVNLGSATLVNGTATVVLRTTLSERTHTINVIYSGSASFAPVTGTKSLRVVQAKPTMTLAWVKNPVTGSTHAQLKITLSATGITPTGSVTVKNGTTVVGKGTLKSGKVTVTLILLKARSSKYGISVTYGGATHVEPKTGTTTLTVH